VDAGAALPSDGTTPRGTYDRGRFGAHAKLREHDSRIRILAVARLVVALSAIVIVIGLVWAHFPRWTMGALAALVLSFLVLVFVHARAFAARARTEASLRFHERGLSRLSGTWRAFPDNGAAYASADHPFSDDLDLFGPSSLFQLLDATETPFGRETLAKAVSFGAIRDDGPPTQTWMAHLLEEQQAVRELAPEVSYRESLAVEGTRIKSDAPDPEPFLAWASAKSVDGIPPWAFMLAHLLPAAALGVFLVGSSFGLPKWSWAAVVGLEIVIAARFRSVMTPTIEAVSAHAGSFAKYAGVFAAATAKDWKAPRLQRIVGQLRLSGSRRGVVAEMAELERIVSFVDARQNEVFRLFIAPVLMWDLHCAARLERWRKRSGGDVRSWFSALGQLEAFASLAGFAFDRPDHAWPTPIEKAHLAAKDLGHPLIDASRRVGNDVELKGPGTALIVTGSNMSGKSTLLRALGSNVVLANMGAPVTAKAFELGFMSLATSMRVRDSLDEGVSHFYAELKKLKRVVDLAKGPPPLFFLLDEILHGTNSRERIIGARSVIEDLVRRGALGAVSTHDLGIAELADALSEAVKNVHFQEQVNADGTMTFDYRLREGTVKSSNALRLMRSIGLDVPLDEPSVDP
jgi:hypothetical protein